MKQGHEKYCHECGAIINLKAEICPKCGVRQAPSYVKTEEQKEQEKEWVIVLLMCWFAGFLGVHRFYTGHIAIGVIQLITLGGCGIWVLVDLIIIIAGNYKDAEGNPIKNS